MNSFLSKFIQLSLVFVSNMGSNQSQEGQPKQQSKNKQMEKIHKKKLQDYISFIDTRKLQCHQNFQMNPVDKLVNIGPQQWWKEANELIDLTLASDLTQPYCKETIAELKTYLSENQPNKYIRTFNNKCYLEYFSILQNQPIQQKHQATQTFVSQDRVQALLRDFFYQNNFQGNSCYKVQLYKQLDPDTSGVMITTQLTENKIETTQKSQHFIFPLIEKEINSSDHMIYDLIQKFESIISEKYKQGLAGIYLSNNQNKANNEEMMLNVERFKARLLGEISQMQEFLYQLIDKLYKDLLMDDKMRTRIKIKTLKELVIKALFTQTNLNSFILQLCEYEASEEINQIEKTILHKALIKTSDLEIKDLFMLPKLQQPYGSVIEHFKLIEQTKCPLGKFEQIAKLKDIICECIDSYYETYPHSKYSTMQKQIDSDTFLSILIYCLVKQGNPKFITHTRFIDAILPRNIAFEYEESSWVWITLCSAVDLLTREGIIDEKEKSLRKQYNESISSVIKQKLAESGLKLMDYE